MMSLPRRLSIDNNHLVMEPAPEAASLRTAPLASLRTAPHGGNAVVRLPTAGQEIRLTLVQVPEVRARLERSFTDDQGTVLLLHTEGVPTASGTMHVGDHEINGIGILLF